MGGFGWVSLGFWLCNHHSNRQQSTISVTAVEVRVGCIQLNLLFPRWGIHDGDGEDVTPTGCLDCKELPTLRLSSRGGRGRELIRKSSLVMLALSTVDDINPALP